jgi:hypothetical protein
MKKLILAAAMVAMAAAADASERGPLGGCRSEKAAGLSVLGLTANGSGAPLGKVLDLFVSLLRTDDQCTAPGANPDVAQPEAPGRLRMNPAPTMGGIFQCPSWNPVLRCDWTGWCWCAPY